MIYEGSDLVTAIVTGRRPPDRDGDRGREIEKHGIADKACVCAMLLWSSPN